MSDFWSSRTKKLEPYIPGEQPKDGSVFIKINTNECPYPPSPKVAEVIKNFSCDSLRLYPNPEAYDAKKTIADYYGLKIDEVFLGNGSDEVLAMAFAAFYDNEKTVNFADVTYSFYPVYCNMFDISFNYIPLLEDFSYDVEGFIKTVGGVVIANPNAPTSVAISLLDIERIVKNHKNDVVIIDEAYVDFGAESAIQLISKYDNLLIVQTMSKSRALAGMRIGFALGNKKLIEGMDRVKNSINSYTLDRLAIAVACAAIEDEEYFKEITGKIIKTREKTISSLKKLDFIILISSANFLFITNKNFEAKEFFEYLRKNGILVRYFNKPRLCDYLRVSIGTDEEMDVFIKITEAYCNEKF